MDSWKHRWTDIFMKVISDSTGKKTWNQDKQL